MSIDVLPTPGNQAAPPLTVRASAGLAAVAASLGYGVIVGWNATVPAFTAFFATIAIATVIDLRERRVPNRLLLVATPLVAGLFIMAAIVGAENHLATSVGGGIALFVVFLVIHLVSPKSFGAGDVKLSFLVGFAICWFGMVQLQWFLIWMWLGMALIGIPILRRQGRSSGAMMPLVPILSGAAVLTVLIAAA